MKTVVIVPTYNERENVENLVVQIRRQPCACHILIGDDNSPDGTGNMADRASGCNPTLTSGERGGFGDRRGPALCARPATPLPARIQSPLLSGGSDRHPQARYFRPYFRNR